MGSEVFLQAGVNADQFLVGPAVILIQAETSFSGDATDGTGFPQGIEDVVDVTTGVAITANGWGYLGYTENINPQRNRTIQYHDSDQEARVEEVHDTWENMITVTALETSLDNFGLFWQAAAKAAAAGATPAQTAATFGNPSTIINRRVCILHPDKLGKLMLIAYRKASLRPTGGPTFTRTGRVEFPLEMTVKSDTRVAAVNARIGTIFWTDAAV